MKQVNLKCKLPKFEFEEVLSLQDASQKSGWEITAFDLPEAWQFSQGEGVVTAVLDCGVQLDHPDIKNNLLLGKNFVNPKESPNELKCCHGTHVTGTICAENNDIGMIGIAPKSKVIPVKVLDSNGSGNMLNVATGIKWAADQGADFICMSLGCPNPVPQVEQAINYAESKGVVTFCAAGNAGRTRQIFYPANYKKCISIGSCNEKYDRSTFSCTGGGLDFLCPGEKIFSTIPENWYGMLSGTSMSTPWAVGIAALVLSYIRKNKTNIKLKNVDDYRNLFRKHTIDIDPNNPNDFFLQGFGILNPNKFYDWMDLRK